MPATSPSATIAPERVERYMPARLKRLVPSEPARGEQRPVFGRQDLHPKRRWVGCRRDIGARSTPRCALERNTGDRHVWLDPEVRSAHPRSGRPAASGESPSRGDRDTGLPGAAITPSWSIAVRSSRVAQCSARRPSSTRNQCVCSALKNRPVGGITPLSRPRFVPSLRTLATTVLPSPDERERRHAEIGKLSQQPLRDLPQMLGPIHQTKPRPVRTARWRVRRRLL